MDNSTELVQIAEFGRKIILFVLFDCNGEKKRKYDGNLFTEYQEEIRKSNIVEIKKKNKK